jgi:hypothetical protein
MMYRVSYSNDNIPVVFFREFPTFSEATSFALKQQFILEIKYYDTKTNNIQDESYNFG